jgi:hypothetical protein
MRWFVALVVMLTAAPALAFEGEVDAKSIGNAEGGVVDFKIQVSKKGDVRINTSTKGPDGKTHRGSYIKPATGKYNYALDHDQKQATRIPKDTIRKMTKSQAGQNKGKKPNVVIKKLGTDKVAGQSTRHIQVIDKDEGHTAELWLSDRYPAKLWTNVFSFGGSEGQSPSDQWTKIMEKEYGFKPGFIMKMLAKDKGGETGGLEVTRMKEGKVAAKEFVLPPGYEVVDVPEMPSGMPSMKMPTTQEEAEKVREEWMKKMQQQQR